MITFDGLFSIMIAGERKMAVFKPNVQKLVASGNIDGLINAARFNDPEIRRSAVTAMGQMRDHRVYHALLNALRDESRAIRIEAIIALGKIRGPSFINSLLWSLNDTDPTVRINAIWALGQIGGQEVVKPLILSMADSEKQVRIKAVETVISMIDTAIPELKKAITGRNQLIRQNVINVLGKTNQMDLVPELIHALGDPVTTVRENAIWALGNLGDPRAVPCLEKIHSKRAAKSLRLIKEGTNWKTVAENYEKAGRYEDAAKIYEMKSQWEEAGRLRNKAKEPIHAGSIPQIIANSLNLRQETIIKDSVISRSRIGKGETQDSVVHRSSLHEKDIRSDILNRSSNGMDELMEECREDLDMETSEETRDSGDTTSGGGGKANGEGTTDEKRTADGYKICPFCGMELKFDKSPSFCPYCAEHL